MADRRKFQYLCSKGHEILSEFEQTKCLAIVRGSPCKGELKRIGPGSRTNKK